MNIETKDMYGTEITIVKYEGQEAEMIGLLTEGNTVRVNEDVVLTFTSEVGDNVLTAPSIDPQNLPDGRQASGMLGIGIKHTEAGEVCCHYYVAAKKDENNSGINIKQMSNILVSLGCDSLQVVGAELANVEVIEKEQIKAEDITSEHISVENVSGATLGNDTVITAGTIKASDLAEKPRTTNRKTKKKK